MIGLRFYKNEFDAIAYTQCAKWCDSNNATITDMGEFYECVAIEQDIDSEVERLKALLTATDHQAIKYAEGVITKKEYQPIKEQREAWRKRIREVQGNDR